MTWQNVLDAMGASRYLPHSFCLTGDPAMLFLATLADGSTAAAYFAIGLTLLFLARILLRSSPDQVAEHVRTFLLDRGRVTTYLILFGLFVFLCGASHATMVLTLWVGIYRADVLVRAAMGGVSIATAILVVSDYISGMARRPDGRGR